MHTSKVSYSPLIIHIIGNIPYGAISDHKLLAQVYEVEIDESQACTHLHVTI